MPPRDEEEISEEEDEDFTGEGHESDTSPKKRKKRKASAFVDDAASEDEVTDLFEMPSKPGALYIMATRTVFYQSFHQLFNAGRRR